MNRCHICYSQRRPSDLLGEEFLKTCLFCGKLFCWPHHSANPIEFRGVTRTKYVYKWQDHSGNVFEDFVEARFLCLLCGIRPQPKNFSAPQHLTIQSFSP